MKIRRLAQAIYFRCLGLGRDALNPTAQRRVLGDAEKIDLSYLSRPVNADRRQSPRFTPDRRKS